MVLDAVLGAALGVTLGKLFGVALGEGGGSGGSGWSISSINSTDTGRRVGDSDGLAISTWFKENVGSGWSISSINSTDTGRRVGDSKGLEMSSVIKHSSKVKSSLNPNDINGDVCGTSAVQKFHTSLGRMLEQSMLKSWASSTPPQLTTEQELQASPSMVTSHVPSTPSIKQTLESKAPEVYATHEKNKSVTRVLSWATHSTKPSSLSAQVSIGAVPSCSCNISQSSQSSKMQSIT